MNEHQEQLVTNALNLINEVRCMLLSNAKSRRAYDKMTGKAEYAVCELQQVLDLPRNDRPEPPE